MSLEESRRSQRPYRYGMVLLCVGALINWLGLAENYVEPVRYVGVACIVAGALLICAAMCCWLHAPPTRTTTHAQQTGHPITAQIDDPIHVISIDEPSSGSRQKPPDYEAVTDAPPSYDDAIKLNPGHLIRLSNSSTPSEQTVPGTVEVIPRDPTSSPPPPYARNRGDHQRDESVTTPSIGSCYSNVCTRSLKENEYSEDRSASSVFYGELRAVRLETPSQAEIRVPFTLPATKVDEAIQGGSTLEQAKDDAKEPSR